MNKSLNDIFLKEYKYIFKKYKPIKKIGEGSFGNIYSIIRLKDKSVFAMKTEKINAKEKILESEAFHLYNLQKGFGIPKFITYGHNKNYNILIETLLGESLEIIFIKKKTKCNIIDVCSAGIQIIDRLEWIHSKNLVHRDIKPDHFLLGINDPKVIYIIDFGLCKKYRSSKTGKHILPKVDKNFFGNIKFSSSNVIKGKQSSRRDDIISLGYMLIYFIKKGLPWDYTYKEKITSSKLFELIYLKCTNAFGNLFNGLPSEFMEFIKYAQNLKFEEDPNYSYLRSILNKIILNKKFINERYIFSRINNDNFSFQNILVKRKKLNLHQRLTQSLEKKRNNDVEYRSNTLLNTINKSNQSDLNDRIINKEYENKNTIFSTKANQSDSSLCNFTIFNTKSKDINNSKGEKEILKCKNFENKKFFSKFKSSNYRIQKYIKPNICSLNNIFIHSKEINKNKMESDSFLKEKISIINKQKKNFTTSFSGNSTSNDKVSIKSFLPLKNSFPINLYYNKRRQNNIKKLLIYNLKIKNQYLNNKNKYQTNTLSIKKEIKNSNFHDLLYNNSQTNERVKIKNISNLNIN